MNYFANEQDWINFNSANYGWYYDNYPFLKTVGLPIHYQTLLDFYNSDMNSRNLTPQTQMQNNYEFLFEYYLANYIPDPNRIQGKTTLGYLWSSIPEGVSKTFNDVSNTVAGALNIGKEIATYLIIGLVVIAVILIVIKLK